MKVKRSPKHISYLEKLANAERERRIRYTNRKPGTDAR